MSLTISLLAVGRLKGPEAELCVRYVERIGQIGRPLGFGRCQVVEIGEARDMTAPVRQEREATQLLLKLPASAAVWALDERGQEMTSGQLAQFLAATRDRGAGDLAFVLGGPDGHGNTLLQRCEGRLSLSRLTLPHGLARVLLTEQLYRALTILANHPYHRE